MTTNDAVDFWIPNLLGDVLPSELVELIEDFTKYDYYEWDQSRRQNLLNQEILMGCHLRPVRTLTPRDKLNLEIEEGTSNAIFWYSDLRYVEEHYCADCGQNKSGPSSGLSFRVRCSGFDECGMDRYPPCRTAKLSECDCYNCYTCSINVRC